MSQLVISLFTLNYLEREGSISTLRFIGTYGGHTLHILFDSGSSLSFIKDSTASLLGCETNEVTPFLIKVASGHKLISSKQVPDFQLDIQGTKITYPLRLLQHEGCDIILGGDWGKAFGPLKLDYDKMTMGFKFGGKKVKLQAVQLNHSCKVKSHHSLFKLLHSTARHEIEEIILVGAQDSHQPEESVYLKLQPYRQNSIGLRSSFKVSSRYYRPSTILEKIGPVAYRLDLPAGSRIHPVVPISLLKKQLGDGKLVLQLPIPTEDGVFALAPFAVLDRRCDTVSLVLVRWEGVASDLTSWEDEKFMRSTFTNFDPCGQGSLNGGSIVMSSESDGNWPPPAMERKLAVKTCWIWGKKMTNLMCCCRKFTLVAKE